MKKHISIRLEQEILNKLSLDQRKNNCGLSQAINSALHKYYDNQMSASAKLNQIFEHYPEKEKEFMKKIENFSLQETLDFMLEFININFHL